MSLHTCQYFEHARFSRGLKPGQVASLAGYGKAARVGQRIREFELTGRVNKELFEKLIVTLELDQDHIQQLIQRDRQEALRAWEAWADEPIKPYVVQRLMPAVYRHLKLPSDTMTLDDAEAWVRSSVPLKSCLVWSRRVSVWFADGRIVGRTEAKPGRANIPSLMIGGKAFKWLFQG